MAERLRLAGSRVAALKRTADLVGEQATAAAAAARTAREAGWKIELDATATSHGSRPRLTPEKIAEAEATVTIATERAVTQGGGGVRVEQVRAALEANEPTTKPKE